MNDISWQASTLNFVSRHTLKRYIGHAGVSTTSARHSVQFLELLGGMGAAPAAQRQLVGGVPCDVLRPARPTPRERVLLYLHGGGFFTHLPRAYRRFAQRLADACRATVYLPDYRLAPEHRYPAATDDCLAVYGALLGAGVDPRRFGVMGDSAGGNLALATLLRARDAGLAMPACASVMSPGADLTRWDGSMIDNAEADPFIPVRALRQVVAQYIDPDRAVEPYASPALGDFSGLPPLEIVVGSTEVLLDSSLTTAAACETAGIAVALNVWQQMPHVFPLFDFLPEGRAALAQTTAFIDRYLAPPEGDQ
ncbi:MAG: alpha/beta hydrolase [Pseudomonadota bacterium]